MFKKILKSTGLALLVTLIIGTTVLAAYSAPITVTETNGTDYDMLGFITEVPVTWLVDNDYMDADALDILVKTQSGTTKPHLVTEEKILAAGAVDADSQLNLVLSTDNTPLTSFDILTGYGGYITRGDDADLELDDDFEIEIQDAYINTDAGADKNIVHKQDAFKTWISGATDITAAIATYDNSYPTVAAVNGGNDVINQQNHTVNLPAGIVAGDLLIVIFVEDEGGDVITFPAGWTLLDTGNSNIGWRVYYRIADGGEGATINVTTGNNEMTAHTSLRITDYSGIPEVGTIASGLDVNPDPPNLAPSWGSQTTLWIATCGYNNGTYTITGYPANYVDNQRNDRSDDVGGVGIGIATRELTAANDNPGTYTTNKAVIWYANTIAIAPATVFTDTFVTATGIASGEHDVVVGADGVDFYISVDGAIAPAAGYDEVALAGASVPDNANSYIIMNNSTTDFMPYMGSFTLTNAGGLRLTYQPEDIIVDAGLTGTLPDLTDNGGYEDGTITWGANPAGITSVIGSMVSSQQPGISGYEDAPARDLMPEIEVSDWFEEPAVTGALLTNPLRPLVTMVSDNTTLSETQVWVWYGIIFVLLVTVTAARLVPKHLAIACGAGGAAVLTLVILTIWPAWALVLLILFALGGWISERSPSL